MSFNQMTESKIKLTYDNGKSKDGWGKPGIPEITLNKCKVIGIFCIKG